VKEAAGVDDGGGDAISRAWGDVRSWYKKNFTMEDGPVVDGEPPAKDDDGKPRS